MREGGDREEWVSWAVAKRFWERREASVGRVE